MFTGRPRRAVNLGSKKQASTHDVLKNAELQRQKREKFRQESAAASILQSKWRAAKLLVTARLDYALSLLNSMEVAFIHPDQFAWILPAFSLLSDDQKLTLTSKVLNSSSHVQYSPILLSRLLILWNDRDTRLHALATRVMQSQCPSSIPMDVLVFLLKNNSESSVLEWASSVDPSNFLSAIFELNSPEIVANLSFESLSHLFTLPRIPPATQKHTGIIQIFISRVKSQIPNSWRFFFSLMLAIRDISTRNLVTFSPEFCNRQVINSALEDDSILLAEYMMTLIQLFPQYKPTILLQLSLASVPSPLTIFWREFSTARDADRRALLLHITTELYSYWLLVATDAELVNNTTLGFNDNDLLNFAQTVRDSAFEALWSYMPNRRVVVRGVYASILKVLRQLYTRDSRMRLFEEGFWLKQVVPQIQFVENLENAKTLFGLDDNDDDDDDEEEEEEEEENGENAYIDMANIKMNKSDSNSAGYKDRFTESKIILKSSPYVRIIEIAPFFIPFEARVTLFSSFINKDRQSQPLVLYDRHHFDINRETLLEEARLAFAALGPKVKNDLHVRLFSNGFPEAGIDGGGLTRELLMAVCEEVFQKNIGHLTSDLEPPAFIETLNHALAPNPVFGENTKLMTPRMQAYFFFLGQVIGKCLYENLLINVEFAPFFLSKWNKYSSNGYSIRSSFDDLSLLDSELYNNISKLHTIHGSQVDELGLDFTIVNSQHQIVDLKPDGASIAVTDNNKLEYMRELANYKLNTSLKPQTTCFIKGLSQVIRLDWLNMFNPFELNKLISGESQDFNVDDLRTHTELLDFHENSPTIQNLWKVLKEFTPAQRASFLKFITSVPKAPLLGFSRLEPRLGIRFVGFDDHRLPTASTCVNLLKLPEYSSLEKLREKLLYSIESKAGFELS